MTMKWLAPLAAIAALGFSSPAQAQAQEFQANIEKAKTTLSNIIALVDKIEARKKAAAAEAPRTVAAAPGGGKTYTIILTGAQ